METLEQTEKPQLKCKDKVYKAFKGRFGDILKLWEADCNREADCNGQEDGVEDMGNIYEYGLSFDFVPAFTFSDQEIPFFRYQISYGGPSEEFRFFVDPHLVPYKIEFWYLDWFDGAKHTLRKRNFEKFKEFFVNYFVETGTAQAEIDKSKDVGE